MNGHLHLVSPPPPGTGFKPSRLVVDVTYTGVWKSKSKWRFMYDPPLDAMLLTVLADLDKHPSDIWVAQVVNDREPPLLHGGTVLLSNAHDAAGRPARHPVAYLTAHVGALPFAPVLDAFQRIGGRPMAEQQTAQRVSA